MARKKQITTPVEIDDVVTMRDWHGEWIEVKVKKLGESPTYGMTVEGTVAESDEDRYGRRTYGKFVALPLSHKVETARVQKIKRGTWTIDWPDGRSQEFKGSLPALKTLCQEHGTVMQEV